MLKFKLNQSGIINFILLLILLAGIVAGVYLVQHPIIFKPKAQENNQVYVNGQVGIIDNLRRSLSNNTTNNIFVYLDIKPPIWRNQSSENDQQKTSFIRVSADKDKLDSDSDCEITGDPEMNCQEIIFDNTDDQLYLSWALPKKSGDYHIFVRFFSNQDHTQDSDVPITYKDSGEIGFEVPAVFIGIQSFVATIFDVFRKVPGTAAFNAAAVFISQVHTAGEQIITLSHAQQLGFNVDLTASENGEIEFLYDQDQLSKLDVSLEFFPDLDPITNEPRLQINPKANSSNQTELAQGTLEIVLGEVGGRLAGHLINTGVTKVADSKAVQTIKSKVKISPKENEAPPPTLQAGDERVIQRGIGRVVGLPVRNIAKMTLYERGWYLQILPLLQTGQAYVLDPNISRPILNKLINGVENSFRNYDLPNLNRKAIMETINNNWIVVIPNNQMARIYPKSPNSGAFTAGRFVVVAEGYADNQLYLAREFMHVIASTISGYIRGHTKRPGVFFRYDQQQAEVYGATMSQIYELFTDEVVSRIFGEHPEAYKQIFPNLYDALNRFTNSLIRTSKGGLSREDFHVFALTGDDKQLMGKMIKSGISPDNFMNQLNREIDGVKLAQIMRATRLRNYDWLVKNKSLLAPVGAAGGGIGLGLLFTSTAHGEELPDNLSIIYELPDQDINLTPSTPDNYLNCSYSQEDSNCPSGFIVCTGHTDDDKCRGKTPEECFNLVQCQYNADLGSNCRCSE